MFGEGNLIGLHSVATGQNVNVVGAEVFATGGNEPHGELPYLLFLYTSPVVSLSPSSFYSSVCGTCM